MYPDMNYFPSIKLKSLPQEPLKNGEQYYADLAGNIKKVSFAKGQLITILIFTENVLYPLLMFIKLSINLLK